MPILRFVLISKSLGMLNEYSHFVKTGNKEFLHPFMVIKRAFKTLS